MKTYRVTFEYVLSKTVEIKAENKSEAVLVAHYGDYQPENIIDEQGGEKTITEVVEA